MTTWKILFSVVGGLLGIVCGEALKLGYTEWTQLTQLEYWLGIGIQTAGLLVALGGMLYQQSPDTRPGPPSIT